MSEYSLSRKMSLDIPREKVFEFFGDAGNLEAITPTTIGFKIITPQPFETQKGTLIDYKFKFRGLPMSWTTLVSEWDPPHFFEDRSIKGPYKQWIHKHFFMENESGGTDIKDEVLYRLPFEPISGLAHWFVRRDLDYIFDYRNKKIKELLTP